MQYQVLKNSNIFSLNCIFNIFPYNLSTVMALNKYVKA